ncbi:MAG TPA: diacylglycerol kinase family protein [Polyangiaceae bacterium]|nr:diacylglycerol kinase family protein [Polyangiaceae bacterium]
MAGIGVVLNPKSRRNLKDPRAARRLASALGDHGVVREARSLDDLYKIAEDFKRLDIDVLGISGGDGTNHVTLTGFIDVYRGSALPQIAFLRGGTMNTVANSVGVARGKPEGLLSRVLRAYAARAVRPLSNVERYVARIGNHYGFLFGTGAVRGFLAEYYAGGPPDPVIAARTLLRGVGSALIGGETVRRMAAPFRGEVHFDDGTSWEERDYLSVAGGTIDHMGLNFRPFHRYAERDGCFHLLGIHASPARFVANLPRVLLGRPMAASATYEAVVPGATIVARGGERVEYMIDGDLHESTGRELRVTTGPKVRIVTL